MKLAIFALLFATVASLPNNMNPTSGLPYEVSNDCKTTLLLLTICSTADRYIHQAEYDPAVDAKNTVDMLLQQGKDQGACADLASATISEVQNSVDAQQKVKSPSVTLPLHLIVPP